MKSIFSIVILISLGSNALGQDLNLTQKTGNLNHFNPSLVGAQSDFGVRASYNNQWPSLPGDWQTGSQLTHFNLKNGFGFGLELTSEIADVTSRSSAKGNFNYGIRTNQFESRFGLSLGYNQQKLDIHNIRFEEQIDPSGGFVKDEPESFSSDTRNYFTLDLGFTGYYRGFLAGASVQQLNQPDVSFFASESQLPKRFVLNLGYLKEFKAISIAALSTYQKQSNFSMLESQVFGQYQFAKLGLGYRQAFGAFSNYDYFSVSAGVQFEKFSIGYSYDDNPFNSNRASFGGIHQATAAWYVNGLNKEKGISRLMNVLM